MPTSVADQAAKLTERAVGVMFLASGSLFANWVARIPALRDKLDLTDRVLGLVLLGMAAGAIVAFRFASMLIARFGSRQVTRLAAAGFCLMLPLPALAPTPWLATVALFCTGAVSGLMDVAMNAQGVEVDRARPKPILSTYHGLFSLGGLCGAIMGAVAAAAGIPFELHLVGAGVLMCVPVWYFGRHLLVDRPHGHSDDLPHPRVRLSPTLLKLGGVAFCSSVGEGAMADWSGVYMRTILHTGTGTAALGFAVYSLAMLTGRFTGDHATGRFGPVPIVRLGGLVVGVGLGVALAINTVPLMLTGLACVGLGLSVVVPVVFRAAGQLPGAAPGAALATLATISYAGFFIGPPAIGFISDHLTLRGGLALVAVLALALSALAGAVHPQVIRATPRTQASDFTGQILATAKIGD